MPPTKGSPIPVGHTNVEKKNNETKEKQKGGTEKLMGASLIAMVDLHLAMTEVPQPLSVVTSYPQCD